VKPDEKFPTWEKQQKKTMKHHFLGEFMYQTFLGGEFMYQIQQIGMFFLHKK